MDISELLGRAWRPALGCTEPASIAFAASLAGAQAGGDVKAVSLRCDRRVFKNCYAVGIPNSEGKTGILWALAIGSLLPDPSLKLECFAKADKDILARAAKLLESNAVQVDVVAGEEDLHIDCRVFKTGGVGRVVIEGSHTRVVAVEKDGRPQEVPEYARGAEGAASRQSLKALAFGDFLKLACELTDADRARIREGCAMNLAMAEQGMSALGEGLAEFERSDSKGRICRAVFSGVHARMSGASQAVMSASGSGNKGITCSVPLLLYGRELKADPRKLEEAIALAILFTELTTEHLGALSAICGCTSAAAIGLAAGLVYLHGGGEREVSHAVSNMVGNISGIICDGAKIGCALKAMTAVEAAFRAAALAMGGICIPVTDGIVGRDGKASLENLGRIATSGMTGLDTEILEIMQAKLDPRP